MDVLGQVVKAYDGCPAGIDGRCNHVAATLFALEQYFKFQATGADTVSWAIVNNSCHIWLSVTCRPTVGQQVTNTLPSHYRQSADTVK